MQLRQTNKEISLGRYGEEEKFSNPFLQSLGLSFAEACCYLVYLAQRPKQRIEENETNGEYLGSEETGSHEENEPTVLLTDPNRSLSNFPFVNSLATR